MTRTDGTGTLGTTEPAGRRLLLRPDAYLARLQDGLYLLTHDGGASLSGASLPDWVEGLTPFLTGAHTRDEITGALSVERRRVVDQVLDALAAKGALREVGERRPGRLTSAEARAYRHELDYLGYFLDSPEQAFVRYRTRRLLLLGSGSLLPAVVGAALRSGLRTVRVQPTADDPTEPDALRAEMDAELARDPDRTVLMSETVRPLPIGAACGSSGSSGSSFSSEPQVSPDSPESSEPTASDEDPEQALVRAVAEADLVLYVGDRTVPELARWLERRCATDGIPLAQAVRDPRDGEEVWFAGPAVGSWGSFCCGWRRLAGLRTRDDGRPAPDEHHRPSASADAGAAVVADQLLHRIFRYVTGVDAASSASGPGGASGAGGAGGAGGNGSGGNGHGAGVARRGPELTVVRTDTLGGDTHAFVRHPFHAPARASSGAEFLAGVAAIRNATRLDAEEFSRRAVRLMDDRVGIFAEIDEGDFSQLPLHVARTVVADPIGLLGERARPEVTGSGPDFETARYRTALRALATYGSLLVDPRRLCDPDGAPLLPADSDPDECLARLRTGPTAGNGSVDGAAAGSRLRGWVRGVDAASGNAVLLAAEQVFPALRTASPAAAGDTRTTNADLDTAAGYRAPIGTAAAYSWPEALQDGLLQHCELLTADEAIESGRRFGAIDVACFTNDSTVAYCQAMLAAITTPDEPVTVHDITGSFGVPTVACAIAGTPLAYASGASWPNAIAEGLWRLLLCRQAAMDGEPAYAPASRTTLPTTLLGDGPPAAPRADRPLRFDDLVTALTRQGYSVAAVPLDHDPEVHAVLPFVVRTVVTDVG